MVEEKGGGKGGGGREAERSNVDAGERSERGGSGDGASVVGASVVGASREVFSCLSEGAPTLFLCLALLGQKRDSFSLLCSLWDTHQDRPTERRTDGETERQTDTRVKDLMASGVPPKGLELCQK